MEEGYEFFARRQLVTIFSAPNYCGEFDNAGAMMSVDDTLMCSFQVCGLAVRGVRGLGLGLQLRVRTLRVQIKACSRACEGAARPMPARHAQQHRASLRFWAQRKMSTPLLLSPLPSPHRS